MLSAEHKHEIEAEENDLDAIVAKIVQQCDEILETIEVINTGLEKKKEILEDAIIARNAQV